MRHDDLADCLGATLTVLAGRYRGSDRVTLVLVEKPDDIVNAISNDTAMIYTTHLGDKLVREASIAKEHNVPLLLDDAAGIPPIDNIQLYAKMKLDLYTFSGGKGLRGPQCSGVLLGRKDLIEAALRNSCAILACRSPTSPPSPGFPR